LRWNHPGRIQTLWGAGRWAFDSAFDLTPQGLGRGWAGASECCFQVNRAVGRGLWFCLGGGAGPATHFEKRNSPPPTSGSGRGIFSAGLRVPLGRKGHRGGEGGGGDGRVFSRPHQTHLAKSQGGLCLPFSLGKQDLLLFFPGALGGEKSLAGAGPFRGLGGGPGWGFPGAGTPKFSKPVGKGDPEGDGPCFFFRKHFHGDWGPPGRGCREERKKKRGVGLFLPAGFLFCVGGPRGGPALKG